MSIEIEENALEVGFIENLFVFGGTEEESGATNVVDEPGNALGMVMQGGDKGVGEKLLVVVGNAEVVFDVSGSLFEIKRGEGIADGDALVEGLVGGETKFSG